jgi:tellurite resistance protein
MQNGKENFTGLVKTIKNKVHDWWVSYPRKLWTERILVYSFLLLLVIFVGAILFAKFNLFHTDANSARYMLSALVQSQAAIVAIVITLTLIAVQLTASAYSPRVIDIFKKNPDMWILLGCYGVSIFYGFIVLKLIEGAEGGVVSQSAIWSLELKEISIPISFESCVSLAYLLGVFTFVALFPYLRNIMNLVKSENIINRLTIEITRAKILNPKEDPIQPIMDIIHGSIMKYDLETTRVGLEGVTERVIDAINSDDKRLQEASDDFCDHLRAVANLAARIGDEQPIVYVIRDLETFMKSKAEKKLEYASMQAIYSIGSVGETAVKKGLEYATTEAAWCLGEVGKTALNEEFKDKDVADVAWYLEEIGKIAAKKELADEAMNVEVVSSLVTIGITAVEKQRGLTICQSTLSLAMLTILSEEIVKTAIQDYESKLEEKDRESFQKFMKIYEQKLEKLRAKK